ncbi:unnamed protein product [Hymenolepis diminuta]|uniref:ADP-ribosylglycohydrolase n=1 Tax=Hymenolepis diminuta TaxID=6216 RepID=A0A0R3SP16_HYMDI|nr:unnamed protein product [Hymenolepis diminuta]
MERFIRGSFYGSVFGDACGAPFELRDEVPLGDVLKFFDKRLSGKDTSILHYTDDSEMALGICESLKRANGFSASDLAKTQVVLLLYLLTLYLFSYCFLMSVLDFLMRFFVLLSIVSMVVQSEVCSKKWVR